MNVYTHKKYINSLALVVDDGKVFANNSKVLINNVKREREICLLKLYKQGLSLPRVSDTFILLEQQNKWIGYSPPL